jgi:hypothetical protein
MNGLKSILATPRHHISADDVIAIRRAIYPDSAISRDEAEAIFVLDTAATSAVPEWRDLFVEAICDHVVHQASPPGYISDADAAWLTAQISKDGRVKSATELELLIRLMERSVDCPRWLAAFALEHVHHAVLAGDGPLANGQTLQPGSVSRDDVELLRRIVWAAAGPGRNAISREEAEVLFDIDEASENSENDPSWHDFFARAVANSILAAAGYEPPSREIAFARSAWLDTPSSGISGFFSRMFSASVESILDAYRRPLPTFEGGMAERNRLAAAAEREASTIIGSEVGWLAERLVRSKTISRSEAALLQFLDRETGNLPPELRALLARAS